MEKEIDKTIEFKQDYLRTEIIEKNFDPTLFVQFFQDYRGEDGMDLDYIHFRDLEKVRICIYLSNVSLF